MKLSKRAKSKGIVGILIFVMAVSVFVTPAMAQINIDGDFEGELGGYDESESTLNPNEVQIEGGFTVEGESAQEAEIVLRGAENTVIATDSISIFVDGSQSVNFEDEYDSGEVRFTTTEIPEGATIQVEYSTYFVGGTDDEQMDVGSVIINHETEGGTTGEDQFTVEADMSESADNKINELETQDSLDRGQLILSYIGAGGIVLLFIALFLMIRSEPDDGIDI